MEFKARPKKTIRLSARNNREELLRRGWAMRGGWAQKSIGPYTLVLSGSSPDGDGRFVVLSFNPSRPPRLSSDLPAGSLAIPQTKKISAVQSKVIRGLREPIAAAAQRHKAASEAAELTILEHTDGNLLTDRWTWSARLRRRRDGRFSLSFKQTTASPPALRAPGLVGFSKSAALVKFLDETWPELTGFPVGELEWSDVVLKTRALDVLLSDSIQEAVRLRFDSPPATAEQLLAQAHAANATWAKEGFRGLAGVGLDMRRRRAATVYALRHLERHGSVPLGVHGVALNADDDDVVPRGKASDRHVVDIAFPVTPPEPVRAVAKPGAEMAALVSRKKDLEVSRVGRVLRGLEVWTAQKLKVLQDLNVRALAESRERGTNRAARGFRGQWQSLEQELYGTPDEHLEDDADQGRGFGASLMDGPSVSLIGVSGLSRSDQLQDHLWDDHNWQSLLEECHSVSTVEVGQQDDVPGMSDVFYWVPVDNPLQFGRELRLAIIRQALRYPVQKYMRELLS